MVRGPRSSPPGRRGRSPCKVAARLPSTNSGQISRPGAPRRFHQSIPTSEKRLSAPKVPDISPSNDPRVFGSAGRSDGVVTTADDVETADGIDDLIIDAPFAPPNDDGTDDPPENEE